MPPLLLDTHAVIWLFEDKPLAPKAAAAIEAAYRDDTPLLVSSITAWEIGLLVSRNRIGLSATPQRWFARVLATPGMQLAEMSPDILVAASFLPGNPPRDPADRILLATARDLGATLVTRDHAILAYGKSGQVSTLAC
ncbi:type II toxin-antitoxin system VapC family toxin [uncultured Bradyrhizobium sp.]|uniref:type II toxin-antitoxin system VapC family toxin n=1 Tax=uncultured Bradyrhizobium sp. TaxID=199684 RepID=UPI0035CA30BC